MTPLIVPGLRGSGSAHWQTWIEQRLAGSRRVEQPDWDVPDLDRWSGVLDREAQRGSGKALLVAHSFGCLAAVDVMLGGGARIGAALLVAPADPARFGIPDDRLAARVAVPTILVASRNDPWMSFERAASLAQRLGGGAVRCRSCRTHQRRVGAWAMA